MGEVLLYIFLVGMGLMVGALAMGIWALGELVRMAQKVNDAWDDVGTALQTPSDYVTVPEYRKFLIQRINEVVEERKRGK